jgi:hypothetical protein
MEMSAEGALMQLSKSAVPLGYCISNQAITALQEPETRRQMILSAFPSILC